MKLYHTSGRLVIVKETSPEFLEENEIDPTFTDAELARLTIPNPSFSLCSGMSPAKNQGAAGTCTSFGVVSCLDYFHGKRDLSEAHLTHAAENEHGDCKAGLAVAHAMNIAKSKGIVDERYWGYDDSEICWASPPDISGRPRYKFRDIATLYHRDRPIIIAHVEKQIRDGILVCDVDLTVPINPVRAIQAVLLNKRTPVAVSVPVWFAASGHFDAGWDFGPTIAMPTPVNLKLWLDAIKQSPGHEDGWHTIAVCSYDNPTGRFGFKNSWGTWWGNDGSGTIPYQYIAQYSDLAMHGWT